ncbi:acyl-CoA dehydrogenase family protein [Nonomuraea thailandensis]
MELPGRLRHPRLRPLPHLRGAAQGADVLHVPPDRRRRPPDRAARRAARLRRAALRRGVHAGLDGARRGGRGLADRDGHHLLRARPDPAQPRPLPGHRRPARRAGPRRGPGARRPRRQVPGGGGGVPVAHLRDGAAHHGGEEIGPAASLGKIFWSELDLRMHALALELLGDRAEDWLDGFLFSLAGPIYAGTNEIQRNIVAERVLGLPR